MATETVAMAIMEKAQKTDVVVNVVESGRTKSSSSDLIETPTTATDTAATAAPEMLRTLIQADCPDVLGHAMSSRGKWVVLAIIGLVQISMNVNASIFGSAVPDLQKQFGMSAFMGTLGIATFLIAYGIGCELWAPWSEELGRRKMLLWSMGLVNLWQIPQIALVFGAKLDDGFWVQWVILVCRTLGGLSSAGGSVTLAIVADLFKPDQQDRAMAFVVWTSCMGAVTGGITGATIVQYCGGRWVFPLQFILGFIVWALMLWWGPETRASVLVTREAERLRDQGQNVKSLAEISQTTIWSRTGLERCGKIWLRPFDMFLREPIVLCLSLISGFSDALIFTFLESNSWAFKQYRFNTFQTGLCLIPIMLGYVVGWGIWWLAIRWREKLLRNGVTLKPEHRLRWLLFTVPLLPIGLFAFAWLAVGPSIHWIFSLVALMGIGIANFATYGATCDYMIEAYGEKYSASATGGNGFARDVLAGVSAFYVKDLYKSVGPKRMNLQLGSTILACMAVLLVIPIFVFYFYGSWFRSRGKYSRQVREERDQEMS